MIELDTNDERGRPPRKPPRAVPPEPADDAPQWIKDLDDDEGLGTDEEQ